VNLETTSPSWELGPRGAHEAVEGEKRVGRGEETCKGLEKLISYHLGKNKRVHMGGSWEEKAVVCRDHSTPGEKYFSRVVAAIRDPENARKRDSVRVGPAICGEILREGAGKAFQGKITWETRGKSQGHKKKLAATATR